MAHISVSWERLTLLFVAAFFGGCGLIVDVDPPDPQLDGGARSDFGALDAGTRDASMFEDANLVDANGVDATSADATIVDATSIDATAPDATTVDGGLPVDLGVDAGLCTIDGDCIGDRCNSGGSCVAGVCVYSAAKSCTDRIIADCTMPVCDPTLGCIAVPAPGACNDDILCTNDVCNVVTGLCSHAADNTVCGDGRDCTVDTCEPSSGCADPVTGCVATPDDDLCLRVTDPCVFPVCVGHAVAATSGCALASRCTVGECNALGVCDTTSAVVLCTRASECDDGDPCNGVETCAGAGTGRRCAPGTMPCSRSPCVYDSASPTGYSCLPDVVCSP